MIFEDLTITQLRRLVALYNLSQKIPQIVKGKRLNKQQLLVEIKKHLFIDDQGLIRYIEKTQDNLQKIYDQRKKEKEEALTKMKASKAKKEKKDEFKKVEETFKSVQSKTKQERDKKKEEETKKIIREYKQLSRKLDMKKKQLEKKSKGIKIDLSKELKAVEDFNKLNFPEPKKEEPKKEEDNFDKLSMELQNLVYMTPINEIASALRQYGFKGSMPSNKILLNLTIAQNIKTTEGVKKLINLLKKEEPKPKTEIQSFTREQFDDLLNPKKKTNLNEEKTIEKNNELKKLVIEILKAPRRQLQNNKDKFNKRFEELTDGKIKVDFVKLIYEAQDSSDFYPTPDECLKPFESTFRLSNTILEPCAGLGFISNFILKNKNKDSKLILQEYNKDFDSILRYFYKDEAEFLNTDDYLQIDEKNDDIKIIKDVDNIIINPPYGRGTNKMYYLDFLFHSLYLFTLGKQEGEKYLNIICPAIVEKRNNSFIDLIDIILYVGKAKIKPILKKYVSFTEKEFNELFKNKEQSDLYKKVSDFFKIYQIQHLGKCDKFYNTNTEAELYTFIVNYDYYTNLEGSGNKGYALHAVVLKKPMNLELAKKTAQNFIKDKKRKYFRETASSYRFRNIPKQKFISKSYRTKKINKEISLIYGKLKPEFMHLEGSGIFDFFKKGVDKVKEFFSPRLDDFNNTSKKTLKAYGDLPIKSLTIYRTPINSLIDTALNAISFGKFGELKKKYGFDKLFHLALVANVGDKNIIIEKNETVNIDTSYKTSSDTQTFNILLGGRNITINQMLETARKKVGDKTFFDYHYMLNNCQFFIRYLLEGQGLYSKQAETFLFQDVEGIYKGLPSYVSKIAKAITTTGAVVSKIRGKGKMKQKKYSNLEGEGLFDDIKEGVKKKFDEFKSKKSMFDGFEPLIESLTPVYNEGLERQPGIRVKNSSRMPPEKVLADMCDKSYNSSGREVDGYELLKQTNTLSFYKKNDTIFIVFRGTNVKDYGDLVADLSIALNNLDKSARYKADYEEIKKFQQEYPPSKYYYIGVGHSLGGALVDEFINNGMLKEGLSFNPAVQKKDYNKDNKHRRIYLSNDPLYKIVGSFSKYHEVRKKDLDIGASHSISNFL